MKYTIEEISQGEDELILRYQRLNEEIEEIMHCIRLPQIKLIGNVNGTQVVIDKLRILYIECVDRKTFVYTDDDVIQVDFTLSQLETILNTVNFFRCSKSMIINIDKIAHIKSLASNRIDAAMCSGEHIIISRTYASDFRKRLKGVNNDE